VIARAHELDARELRRAGTLMLGAGAALAALPGHEGVPCPLRTLTGIPCPLCGGTTSVEEAFRGHFGDSLAASPLGLLAIVSAVLLIALRPARVRVSPFLVLAVAAGAWLFELHRFSII